jgi:hypothetical protein
VGQKVVGRNTLAGSASYTWVYDYGNFWAHKVKLERIVDLGVPLEAAVRSLQ